MYRDHEQVTDSSRMSSTEIIHGLKYEISAVICGDLKIANRIDFPSSSSAYGILVLWSKVLLHVIHLLVAQAPAPATALLRASGFPVAPPAAIGGSHYQFAAPPRLFQPHHCNLRASPLHRQGVTLRVLNPPIYDPASLPLHHLHRPPLVFSPQRVATAQLPPSEPRHSPPWPSSTTRTRPS